ncbi:MAG: aryl-sulfate sulfotransferase [Ignavibacteriales bacterium]|nr:aryl-sulfate sulfotransferase [Ignavibacteriales bacterium]
MKTRRMIFTIMISVLYCCTGIIISQTKNMGLILNETAKAYDGYTLFAPKQYTATYLINNEGKLLHSWTKSQFPPGQSVYLLENGHLLRSCMTKGQLSSGGGEGGRIEEYDWDGNLVWSTDFSASTYMQHHDIKMLPNGNIIMLVIEKKTLAEVEAAGFDNTKFQPEISQKGMMLPDYVAEIKPNYVTKTTYDLVWEWHTWDHLIQSHDATKNNYGVPKNHPELVDCAGDGKNLPSFWNHMNAIDYNPKFDQIAMSVRGNSEVWIIDHSTTTAEAAGHTGGKRGKGGDLLYRWGNPYTYGAGTVSTQRYFQQHDVEWVKPGYPGSLTYNMTCYNNGLNRAGFTTNQSSADEFTPAVDSNGNYASVTAGSPLLPANLTWTYLLPVTEYSENISGAYRLPNGNTLICSGTLGLFQEVTPAKEVVWKYICPVAATGPMTQGQTIPSDLARPAEFMNSVFRVYRYPKDYAAFTGRTLTPGGTIEIYSSGVIGESGNVPSSFEMHQNYPNPFNPETTIGYQLPASGFVSLKIYDVLGQEIATLVNEEKSAGTHEVKFNGSHMASGIYYYAITAGSFSRTMKMICIK